MVGESSEARQKPEAEQSRGKNIGEKYSASIGKCAVQGRLQWRIIWRKRGTDCMEGRRSKLSKRSMKQLRRTGARKRP